MTAQTLTLTDFLLARIAEDEAVANAGAWGGSRTPSADLPAYVYPEPYVRHDPSRLLAECEAKRRIVSRCDLVIRGSEQERMFNAGQEADARDNLRSLALPYADHPDYREEWKP